MYPFRDLICRDFGLTFIFFYLQDAALLRREFPQHDLFNDPIFSTSEYVEFEAAVTAAVEAARDEDPHLVAVQKALPAVCDSLRTVTGVVKTGLESNDSSMRCMNSSMQHIERRMATLENVVFTPGSRGVHAPPSRSSWTDARSNGHRGLEGTAANTPLVAWHHHDHRPVEGVDCGLGGQLLVEDLDGRWGSRWRHGAEFQFYSRRKVVITDIKRLVAGGREAREMVDSLETERVRAKASLSQVINRLKAAAKAREGGN